MCQVCATNSRIKLIKDFWLYFLSRNSPRTQSLPYADAMNKTLVFAIFDFDRFSKHDQIGEVKVPLCQIDLAQTIEEWRELQSVEGEGGQVRHRFRFRVRLVYPIIFDFFFVLCSYRVVPPGDNSEELAPLHTIPPTNSLEEH